MALRKQHEAYQVLQASLHIQSWLEDRIGRGQEVNPDIHMMVTRSAKELADLMDAKFLEFFGSEEQMKAYAHLFVIEQLPTGFATVPGVEGRDNQFIFHAETEIRIRPKTQSELEVEGINV